MQSRVDLHAVEYSGIDSRVRERLSRVRGIRAGTDWALCSAVRLSQRNRVYCIWPRGTEEPICLKLFGDVPGAKERYETEMIAAQRVKIDESIEVPRQIATGELNYDDTRYYSVTSWHAGPSLYDMASGGVSQGTHTLKRALGYLRSLWKLEDRSWLAPPKRCRNPFLRGGTLPCLSGVHMDTILQRMDHSILSWLESRLSKNRSSSVSVPIHGDFSLRELIVQMRPPCLVWVDWETICVGDPAADIAALLYSFCNARAGRVDQTIACSDLMEEVRRCGLRSVLYYLALRVLALASASTSELRREAEYGMKLSVELERAYCNR